MNVLVLIGGCWVNRYRGKAPRDVGDEIDDANDAGTCEDEDGGDDEDEDTGECDPDDDSGSCWDPPDPGW